MTDSLAPLQQIAGLDPGVLYTVIGALVLTNLGTLGGILIGGARMIYNFAELKTRFEMKQDKYETDLNRLYERQREFDSRITEVCRYDEDKQRRRE